MMKFYISFNEILSSFNDFYIKEYFDNSFAHKKELDNKNIVYETLYEHSYRSLYVSHYLIFNEKILNKFLIELNKNLSNVFINISEEEKQKFLNIFLKGIFFSVFFHDFGKQNYNFQSQKMDKHEYKENEELYNYFQNKEFKYNGENYKIGFSSSHSIFNNLNFENKGVLDYLNNDIEKISNLFSSRTIKNFKEDIVKFFQNFVVKHHNGLLNEKNELTFKDESFKNLFAEDLSFISELFHSILINSDVIATKYFMEENTETTKLKNYLEKLFFLSNDNLKNKFNLLETTKEYNKNIYENDDFSKITDINIKSKIDNAKNLNELKFLYSKYIKDNQIINNDMSFLYGKVGIGKTNLSFITSNEFLKQNNELNKFIFVSPLNNLIYQVKNDLKETLSILDIDISIINYIETKSVNNEDKSNYKNSNNSYFIKNFNSQFILTTSVNFFEKLFHKEKKDITHLIYLQNSFIVIDELQLLNDNYFNLIYNYLNLLQKYLNIKILIISATIPIPKYTETNIINNINYLINKDIMNYFNESKLLERVKYNVDFFDNNLDSSSFKYLLNKKENKKILIVHNTIQKLQNFYEKVKNDIPKDYEIYFYNNNIIKPVLDNIIKKIKEKDLKIIVFSTKKIETGVDVEFSQGIKFVDSFDNIEQFSGRINRYFSNVDSEICILKDNEIYFNEQIRDKVLKGYSTNKIVVEKYLNNTEEYYKKIFNETNDIFINKYNNLNHKDLNDIQLINEYKKENFIINLDFSDINILNLLNNDLIDYINKNNIKYSIDFFDKSKTYFYNNINEKYRDNFIISGFINKKTKFYKNELKNLKLINISINNKYKDEYRILNYENFYYDLNLGIIFNKDLEVEEILDTFNI